MNIMNREDEARYRTWIATLQANCKICNYKTSSNNAFTSHLNQSHAMSKDEYILIHGTSSFTTTQRKTCLVCNSFNWVTLRDLQGHLREHNIDTLGHYFMQRVKPTLDQQPQAGPSTPPRQAEEDQPDMSFLDNLEEWSDFTVVLESGQQLRCHKVTLAKWSPALEAMLKTECVETQNGEIKIRGYDDKTVKAFIEYLYQGKLTPDRYTIELLRIADQYQVKRFFTDSFKALDILESLIKTFRDDNVVEFWQLAEAHGASNLRVNALLHIVRKGKKLLTLKGMETMEAEKLKTLLEYTLQHPKVIPNPT